MSVLDSIESAREKLRGLVTGCEGGDGVASQVKSIVEKYPELCREKDGSDDGNLPLHDAVIHGAPMQVLKMLVSCYTEALLIKNENARTPLQELIITYTYDDSSPEMEPYVKEAYRLLISPEAARVQSLDGDLPLHCYCEHHLCFLDLQVIQWFIEAFPESLRDLDRYQRTPLHRVCCCPWEGNLPAIRFMIESYPDALVQVDHEGYTPLHVACEEGDVENLFGIRTLAEAYPQAVRAMSNTGISLLLLLYWKGEYDVATVIRFFTEISPESLKVVDSNGRTQLHRFCDAGADDFEDLEIIQSVVNVYPQAVTTRDSFGDTPLHIACRSTEVGSEITCFLARRYEDNDISSESPLHIVCESLHDDNRDKLLKCLRAMEVSVSDAMAKDCLGRTPLHVLCQRGANIEECKVLLDKSSDVLGIPDNQGQLPLHAAIEGRVSSNVVQHLVHLFPRAVHVADKNGMMPLELACEKGADVSTIYHLVSVDPVFVLGLEKKGEVTQHDGLETQGKAKRRRTATSKGTKKAHEKMLSS